MSMFDMPTGPVGKAEVPGAFAAFVQAIADGVATLPDGTQGIAIAIMGSGRKKEVIIGPGDTPARAMLGAALSLLAAAVTSQDGTMAHREMLAATFGEKILRAALAGDDAMDALLSGDDDDAADGQPAGGGACH